MNDLTATAQRLREVKEATQHFLTLWAVEETRDRVASGEETPCEIDTPALEAAILELDVYASESLVRGVLADGDK